MATLTPARKRKPIGGTSDFLTDSESAQLDQACRDLGGVLLTPRLASGKRIGIVLAPDSSRRGTVTDLYSGRKYRVKAAACGLRCYCDALATEVKG